MAAPKRRTTARGATRLKKTLAGIGMSAEELAASDELIKNVGFLEDRLFNARIDIADAPLVVEYDNGGGKCGTRKNPIFDVYAKLYVSYVSGLKALLERLPVSVTVTQVADTSIQSKRDLIASLRATEANRGGGQDGE